MFTIVISINDDWLIFILKIWQKVVDLVLAPLAQLISCWQYPSLHSFISEDLRLWSICKFLNLNASLKPFIVLLRFTENLLPCTLLRLETNYLDYWFCSSTMAPKRNNMVPNGHFHKQWQNYVKTWFNQVCFVFTFAMLFFLQHIPCPLVARS